MNSDIRLSVGFWQHPKTKKTARRLGLEGARSLQVLWAWAAVNRPEGNLSGMDWEDVELAADWQGEERKFFDTCLGMWIDESPDGYVLHDWQEHNPWVAEAEMRGGQSRMAKLAQVNRDAYHECLRRGIEGLSQEEYQRWKVWRRTHDELQPGDSNASDLLPFCDRTATAERPLAKPSAPLPSPEEKDKSVFNACARVERLKPEENPTPESRQPSVAFDEFFEAFPEPHRGSRSEAEGEWVALESNRALPGLPRILDALGQWEDSDAWKQQGGRYVPSAANFLKREYWLRKPPEPVEQGGNGNQARPRAATVAQQRVQDNDDMAKMLLQARRAQHAQPGLYASTAGQSGAALPAGR